MKHSPTYWNCKTNRNQTSVSTVTMPYIKGTSETIRQILQPYNIRIAHKPVTMLRHLLTNIKDRDEPNNRQGAVYNIKCSAYQASYIGKTSRNLNTRLTEKKLNEQWKKVMQQSHCWTSSIIDKPQNWLGLYSMLNLQYELFSTTDSGKRISEHFRAYFRLNWANHSDLGIIGKIFFSCRTWV